MKLPQLRNNKRCLNGGGGWGINNPPPLPTLNFQENLFSDVSLALRIKIEILHKCTGGFVLAVYEVVGGGGGVAGGTLMTSKDFLIVFKTDTSQTYTYTQYLIIKLGN